MRKVVVSEFVTLDGVMEDPGGAEGSPIGGWAFRFERGPEGDRFKLQELLDAEALLLGRRTYEGFAEAWPSRSDEQGFAARLNTMPKYVVSSTLTDTSWANTTVLSGDAADAVAALKRDGDGNLLVAGSGELVRTLLRDDLVDELRLMVFPVVAGRGERLWPDDSDVRDFELVDVERGDATTMLTLRRAG